MNGEELNWGDTLLMVTCLLRELPQGKTQIIHPQTRAVIQRGFPPSSKIWRCLNALRHRHRCVYVHPDRNAHFFGRFSPKPNWCPANAASRGGCRSPSKKSKNQHQQLLNNMTTFILDKSQLIPCFLSSKPSAFLMGCLMLSGCLLPTTSNRLSSHICRLTFLFLYSFHYAKGSIHCVSPRILFLIQKQIHIPVQTFLSSALLYKAHSC